jgi:hypothetical protein|eukprot:COSAG06_NODE_1313_length_9887_cov_27.577953_7_plen_67_part_00
MSLNVALPACAQTTLQFAAWCMWFHTRGGLLGILIFWIPLSITLLVVGYCLREDASRSQRSERVGP